MATRAAASFTETFEAIGDDTNLDTSADWTNLNSATGNVIVEDQGDAMAQGTAAQSAIDAAMNARLNTSAATLNDDQWVEAEFQTSFLSNQYKSGVIARAGTGTNSSREFWFFCVDHNAAGNLTTSIGKVSSGPTLNTLHSASVAWADGDIMSLEVEGQSPNITLKAYKDTGSGPVELTAFAQTGQSGQDSGQPGILAAGRRTAADTGITLWAAGNFAGGASVAPLGGIAGEGGLAGMGGLAGKGGGLTG